MRLFAGIALKIADAQFARLAALQMFLFDALEGLTGACFASGLYYHPNDEFASCSLVG